VEAPRLALCAPPYETRRQRRQCPRLSPRYVSRFVRRLPLLAMGLVQYFVAARISAMCKKKQRILTEAVSITRCASRFRPQGRVSYDNVAVAILLGKDASGRCFDVEGASATARASGYQGRPSQAADCNEDRERKVRCTNSSLTAQVTDVQEWTTVDHCQ
jgi:hypothetical protein